MTIFTYALGCYFAAALLVAGLAKLADPAPFAALLRRSRLVPGWGVAAVGYLVPVGEIALAALLASGLARRLVALGTTLLFVDFLGARLFLLVGRHEKMCGCYGGADADRLDEASIGTSMILVSFALVYLWFVSNACPPPPALRIVGSTAFAVASIWLIFRMRQRALLRNTAYFYISTVLKS